MARARQQPCERGKARANARAGNADLAMPAQPAMGTGMARKHPKHGFRENLHPEEDEAEPVAKAVPCWLCGRETGKIIVWHHPVPKSRGGRDVVPMHPVCQQTLIANFTNSELQRHGMDVEAILTNPNVRKFVDWVANKDPDFTATMARKQR
jgi:hypothetical protein